MNELLGLGFFLALGVLAFISKKINKNTTHEDEEENEELFKLHDFSDKHIY